MFRGTRIIAPVMLLMLALAGTSCSTSTSGATLASGMTTDQAVDAMGQPDLKDSVADPNHPGATVLRYVWLDSGKVAVFGSNNRVASVQQIEPAAATKQQLETASEAPTAFDPIDTPLNYAFYPIRAGLIYLGAGLNCVAGGGCRKPQLPSPGHG
ncbi:MAG TPA: hypothetical protein VNF27_07865 [Candidatus Binataceae bacterium]|nr:hypothetical protein [Candidatus Binataceae bacterium]